MRNRYAGECSACGTWVPEDCGTVNNVDGEWLTRCEECDAETERVIAIRLFENIPVITPKDFLGSDLFETYRQACDDAGSRFSKPAGGNVVSWRGVARAKKELEARGFAVEIEPDVAARMQAFADRATAQVVAADGRLDELDVELEKRGQALFGFQRTGTKWLAPKPAALLADDMGLGKTVQVLVSIPDNVPVLVVCPAIAKSVWLREQPKWRPGYRVTVLSGRNSFRWPEPGEIVVTNYDILPNIVGEGSDAKLRKHVQNSVGTETVIVADEAQALKNWKAQRTKRFRAISKLVRQHDGKAWLLTATPLENRPQELWGVLGAAGLDVDAFSSWDMFVELCGGKKLHFGGYEWGKPSKVLNERLGRIMLRRMKRDVLPDLPTKIYSDQIVKIGARSEAAKLSTEFVRSLRDAGIDLESATRQAIMSGIREIGFDEISLARAALATAKIPDLIRIVEQYEDAAEPLIVFSAHRAPIDALADRDGWGVITGDTPPAERGRLEDAFQAGDLVGIAGTIKAAGTAITLTRGNQVLFVDSSWTPALNSQAEDRACRIGQTRGVQIIRLIADHPLDRAVSELLDTKQSLIDNLVERPTAAGPGGSTEQLAADAAAVSASLVPMPERPETPSERTPANGHNGARPAGNAKERWAERAMSVLAARGGFESVDELFGDSIAGELATGRGLTDDQWRAALAVGKKYWSSLGPTP